MSDDLLNAVKRHVQAMNGERGQPRWGVVSSVDPSGPAVKVTIQPENVMTGWLPIASHAASAGWGVYSLPSAGDMAWLVPDLGDAQHMVVAGFAHNDAARPANVPASIAGAASHAQPGEIMLVSKTGAVVRLAADGTIYLRGNTFIEGNLIVSGDISDQNGLHQTMGALRTAYNAHHHTQGSDSRGDAEVPTDTTDRPVT